MPRRTRLPSFSSSIPLFPNINRRPLRRYATFGGRVGSDVLTSFADDAAPVVVARVFVACLVCFSYPLQCFPARAAFTTVLASCYGTGAASTAAGAAAGATAKYGPDTGGSSGSVICGSGGSGGTSSGGGGTSTSGGDSGGDFDWATHAGLTAGFLCCSTAIALCVTELGSVLAIVGATGSTTVSCVHRGPPERCSGAMALSFTLPLFQPSVSHRHPFPAPDFRLSAPSFPCSLPPPQLHPSGNRLLPTPPAAALEAVARPCPALCGRGHNARRPRGDRPQREGVICCDGCLVSIPQRLCRRR